MSTTSLNDLPVVAADTVTFLEKEGLLTAPQDHKRKLSISILSSSSRSSSSKTSASSAFTAASIHDMADEVVIPENLKSKETLAFIGFTEDMAVTIYHRYITKPADQDEELLDFAVGHIELHPVDDAFTNSDDWHGCLRTLGINDRLSNAIMMPEYDDIRFTGSCKFWILDSIISSYHSLADLNDELRAAQLRIQRARKPGRKHAGSVSETPSAPSPSGKKGQASSSSSAGPAGPAGTTGPPKGKEKEVDTGEIKDRVVVAKEAPQSLPAHHMIWRGSEKRQANDFYNPNTQEIDLDPVVMRPGEFSGRKAVAYFTLQKETADRYAGWKKNRATITEVVIIQIAVPDELINSLSVQYLWQEDRSRPDHVWKNLIWHSRRSSKLPKDLTWLSQKGLLIGHIASGKDCKFIKMKEPADIKDTDVLTIKQTGRDVKAIQWVFNTDEAEYSFVEKCAGKVWVHPMGTLKVPKYSEEESPY